MNTNQKRNVLWRRHVTSPPTASSAKPTRTCLQCNRTWVGREIERNFYRNQPSYCKFCHHTVVATQHWLKARGLWARDVPRRIRKRYRAGMLRVCQAAGIVPSDLGWRIATDMAQYPPTGI